MITFTGVSDHRETCQFQIYTHVYRYIERVPSDLYTEVFIRKLSIQKAGWMGPGFRSPRRARSNRLIKVQQFKKILMANPCWTTSPQALVPVSIRIRSPCKEFISALTKGWRTLKIQ